MSSTGDPYDPFYGDGWCERVINWHVKQDTTLLNCVSGAIFVVSLGLLMRRLGRAYKASYAETNTVKVGDGDGKDASVLPVWFSFAGAASVFVILQALWLLLPADSVAVLWSGHALYLLHSLLDNFPLFFLLHARASDAAAERAMWACFALIVVKAGVLAASGMTALHHPWCSLFFPVAESMLPDVAFALGYAALAVAVWVPRLCPSRACWAPKGRPALRGWVLYLASVYTLVVVAAALLYARIDAGHCVIGGAMVVYSCGFAAALMVAAVSDSAAHHAQRAFEPLMVVGGDGSVVGEGSARLSSLVKRVFTRQHIINFAELQLRGRVGQGGYGEVFRATWRGTEVAVKKLRPDVMGLGASGGSGASGSAGSGGSVTTSALEQFCGEVGVMQQLRHPHVLLFLGVSLSRGVLCIITEFCARGSVWDVLRAREGDSGTVAHRTKRRAGSAVVPTPAASAVAAAAADEARVPLLDGGDGGTPEGGEGAPFDDARTLSIVRQCAMGLAYLHGCSPPVMHRDLKSGNLMVDASWRVKVGDFGLSKQMWDSEAHTRIGSVQWTAPEVLLGRAYDPSCDVWSFGVVCWEVLTGKAPFVELTAVQVAMAVAYEGARLQVDGEAPIVASGSGRRGKRVRGEWSNRASATGGGTFTTPASGAASGAASGSASAVGSSSGGGGGSGRVDAPGSPGSRSGGGSGGGSRTGSGEGGSGGGSGEGSRTGSAGDAARSPSGARDAAQLSASSTTLSSFEARTPSAEDVAAQGATLRSSLTWLMQKCWAVEPSARPTFAEVVAHLNAIGDRLGLAE